MVPVKCPVCGQDARWIGCAGCGDDMGNVQCPECGVIPAIPLSEVEQRDD